MRGRRKLGFALWGAAALASLLPAAAAAVPGPPSMPVVADGAGAACSNATIRAQQSSSHLPNCRAYEMVSPQEKNGGDVTGQPVGGTNGNVAAAADGSKAFFESYQAFADPEGAPVQSGHLGTRGADDWASKGIVPPSVPVTTFLSTRYTGFTPDLSRGVLGPVYGPSLAPGAPSGFSNLYTRDLAAGAFEAVTTAAPPEFVVGSGPIFATASADLGTVAFEHPQPLTPEAPAAAPNNVYATTDGVVRYVSLLPGEVPAAGGADVGSPGGASFQSSAYSNAVSADGSLIFFSSPSILAGPPAEPPQLYVRIDGAETVQVSESQRAIPDPNGPQEAIYQGASVDGSRVFFTSKEELTDDAETGAAEAPNLYMFEVATETLTDLTVAPSEPSGAQVEGVVGISASGDHVYFIAAGALADGAVAGASNLYLWRSGEGVRFIAALDQPGANIVPDSAAVFPRRSAALTPDGRFLIFTTATKLSDYENGGFSQVYRYSLDDESLACVSCNPSGAVPEGPSAPGARGGPAIANLPPRSISVDGRRVFFNSEDALVPADSNAQQDVYLWEEGEVSLISGGTSNVISQFGDASASGDDVFFLTRQALVAQDRDANTDLYDARVGGGLAAQNVLPAPPCEGEACRGPGVPAPPVGPVASSTLIGPGNPKPRRKAKCRKQVRKKSAKQRQRCAKKKTRRQGRGARRAQSEEKGGLR